MPSPIQRGTAKREYDLKSPYARTPLPDERWPDVCEHCGLPIKRETHNSALGDRPTRSPSGWTHGGPMRDDWQGIRCPGRLTGAVPANEAHHG